ncbi:MAG: ABC transporter substrate-binding protein [Devosia sp.]|nr:ABC transporter substrate-binding protein [Devosia sp.]
MNRVNRRVFVAAALLSCFASPVFAQDQDFVFGFMMPAKTVLGKQGIQAAEVAADMLNAEGGVLGKQVRLAVYDDNQNPSDGALAAQRAIDQDGARYLGGNVSSSVALAIIPVAMAEGALYIAVNPKSSRVTEEGHESVFQLNTTSAEDAAALQQLFDELKAEKVAYMGDNTDFGREFGDTVRKLTEAGGGQFVYSDFWENTQSDYNAQVTLAKASGADTFIVMGGVTEQVVNVIRSARDLGFDPRNTVVGGGALNNNVIRLLGEEAEDIKSVDIYLPTLDTPLNNKFVAAYQEKWGEIPEKTEMLAFESVWLVGHAINKAGTDDVAVVSKLLREGEWESPRGMVHFGPENRIVTEGFVVMAKNGQIIKK